jgi:prolipoprotein diacylglyceryl transferase
VAPHILAAIPSPTQGVWHLGPLPLRAYALCIVLGIVAACVVTEIRMRKRGAPQYAVLDVAVLAVPFGIVGARIYHVITSPAAYFGADGHPIDALKIWQGGLGIWGGVAGGALGAWIACRRMGLPLTLVADAIAPALPLAQAIGRWGNWFNNELYGRETNLPWGLKVYVWDLGAGQAVTESGTGEPIVKGVFHPTFLYESLWDVGVAVLVWALDRRYRFGKARAFALYVMAYTVGRFWIEAMRSDDASHFLGMRLNNWTSIVVFLGALAYFLRVKGRREHLVAGPDGTLVTVQERPDGSVPAALIPAEQSSAEDAAGLDEDPGPGAADLDEDTGPEDDAALDNDPGGGLGDGAPARPASNG